MFSGAELHGWLTAPLVCLDAAPVEMAQLHGYASTTLAQLRAVWVVVPGVETLGVRCGSVMPIGARACRLVFNPAVSFCLFGFPGGLWRRRCPRMSVREVLWTSGKRPELATPFYRAFIFQISSSASFLLNLGVFPPSPPGTGGEIEPWIFFCGNCRRKSHRNPA